jgi:hypothetical protein
MVRSQTFQIRSTNRPLQAVFGTYQVGTRRVTTCELVTHIDGEFIPVSDGASICMPNDHCTQLLGEKKALAAAMREFSRGTREVVQEQLERYHAELHRATSGFQEMLLEERGYGAGV